MFNQMKKRADWTDKSVSQKGFTLIELLVVIAILGILAVVGVLSFGGLTDSAKNATKTTEKTQVQTAVDAYRAINNGTFPANTAAMVPGEIKSLTDLQCTYDVTVDPVVQTCP